MKFFLSLFLATLASWGMMAAETPEPKPAEKPEPPKTNPPSDSSDVKKLDEERKGSTTTVRPPMVPASQGALGTPEAARVAKERAEKSAGENAKPK